MIRTALIAAALGLATTSCHVAKDAFVDGGGWVMKHPTVHMVFWGSYWQSNPAEAAGYVARWDALMNSPGDVLERLAEYGVGSGVFDTAVAFAAPAAAGTMSSFDLIGELDSEILTGTLPIPSADTIYMIMLPPNTTTDLLVSWNATGYHAASVYNDVVFTYAVIGYGKQDVIVSHELYEAATDPTALGWVNWSNGQELADACANHYVVDQGTWVATVWSNDNNGCR